MKNIYVLPVLVIIIGLSAVNNFAYCQDSAKERKYIFSLGTNFGFVHGLAFEYVYPIPNDTKGEFLSELRYDMKPVFFYGIHFDYKRGDLMGGPGFFASASFKTGFAGDSGTHENRDWISVENNSLTYFSAHTNKTNELIWLDITLGTSFPVKQYFYIKPLFNVSWMHFSFTGRDGYGIYSRGKVFDASGNPIMFYSIDDNPIKRSYNGKEVIRYMQDWYMITTGFIIGTNILSPFSFDLSFQISPFTFCAATDEHIERKITFKDYTGWGLLLEPKGNISVNLENIIFSLELTYRYIGRTRGISFYDNGNTGFYYQSANEAGAGLSLLNTCFLVRVFF